MRLVFSCLLFSILFLFYFLSSFEMKNELKLTSLASSLTQTQPFSPATKISIACIYHLQHQIDKAYNLYCLAVQILPTSSLLWSLLGQL